MPRARNPAARGAALERQAQRWLEARGWTVHRAGAQGIVRRGGRVIACRSHDLFGALDLLAIRRKPAGICGRCRREITPSWTESGRWVLTGGGLCACNWIGLVVVDTWGWQLTTAANRAARRRKIEAVPWPRAWRVSVITITGLAWRIEDLVEGRWRGAVEERA